MQQSRSSHDYDLTSDLKFEMRNHWLSADYAYAALLTVEWFYRLVLGFKVFGFRILSEETLTFRMSLSFLTRHGNRSA